MLCYQKFASILYLVPRGGESLARKTDGHPSSVTDLYVVYSDDLSNNNDRKVDGWRT